MASLVDQVNFFDLDTAEIDIIRNSDDTEVADCIVIDIISWCWNANNRPTAADELYTVSPRHASFET